MKKLVIIRDVIISCFLGVKYIKEALLRYQGTITVLTKRGSNKVHAS